MFLIIDVIQVEQLQDCGRTLLSLTNVSNNTMTTLNYYTEYPYYCPWPILNQSSTVNISISTNMTKPLILNSPEIHDQVELGLSYTSGVLACNIIWIISVLSISFGQVYVLLQVYKDYGYASFHIQG
jgi:hypothetical protein